MPWSDQPRKKPGRHGQPLKVATTIFLDSWLIFDALENEGLRGSLHLKVSEWMYEVKIVYQVFIKFLLVLGIECSIKMSEAKIVKIYSTFVKFLVAIECSIMYGWPRLWRFTTIFFKVLWGFKVPYFHLPRKKISQIENMS